MECLFLALVCYAIYRESDLVRFERRVWFYIKAFVKALYCTIKDQINKVISGFNAQPIQPKEKAEGSEQNV